MWIRIAAVLAAACTTLAAQAVPASEHIVGVGNLIRAVSDLDRSLAFYRDTLGMDVQAPPGGAPAAGSRPFIATPEILKLYDATGGRYRVASTMVQGSPMRVELIEFADVERRAVKRRLQDPGAVRLMLTVRDIDAALLQARFSGATVLSEGDAVVPMEDERGRARAILLQDPDGFFVQLTQRDAPPPPDAPPGNVVAVTAGLTVDDMDRTVRVFQDVLGFDLRRDPEDNDDARLAMLGVFTAFYRRVLAVVPGTSFELELLEVHGLDRRQVTSRPRDPGTAILRLRAAEMDKTVSALANAGVKVVSEGGPVTVTGTAGTQRYAIASTADRFFVQLVSEK